MMLEVVMDMEFDKVTDEVADMMVEMEINKVAEMVTLVKIVWFIDESRKYAIVIKEKKCCFEEVIKEVGIE